MHKPRASFKRHDTTGHGSRARLKKSLYMFCSISSLGIVNIRRTGSPQSSAIDVLSFFVTRRCECWAWGLVASQVKMRLVSSQWQFMCRRLHIRTLWKLARIRETISCMFFKIKNFWCNCKSAFSHTPRDWALLTLHFPLFFEDVLANWLSHSSQPCHSHTTRLIVSSVILSFPPFNEIDHFKCHLVLSSLNEIDHFKCDFVLSSLQWD